MDAVQLLKKDHDEVKQLFKRFESARGSQEKKKIAEQVFKELEVHSKIEEEIFYPAVREKAGQEGKEMVLESIEEHHVVDVLIGELRKMNASDEQYEAKFTVLQENVEHHIEEEEGEMFPQAKEVMGQDMQELGARMEQRKRALMGAKA